MSCLPEGVENYYLDLAAIESWEREIARIIAEIRPMRTADVAWMGARIRDALDTYTITACDFAGLMVAFQIDATNQRMAAAASELSMALEPFIIEALKLEADQILASQHQ